MSRNSSTADSNDRWINNEELASEAFVAPHLVFQSSTNSDTNSKVDNSLNADLNHELQHVQQDINVQQPRRQPSRRAKSKIQQTQETSDVEEEPENDEDEDKDIDDSEILYCICKKPDTGKFMIQCDKCDEWYHGQCVGVTKRQSKEMDVWHCFNCESTEDNPSTLDQVSVDSSSKSRRSKRTARAAKRYTPENSPVMCHFPGCSNEAKKEHDGKYCSPLCAVKHGDLIFQERLKAQRANSNVQDTTKETSQKPASPANSRKSSVDKSSKPGDLDSGAFVPAPSVAEDAVRKKILEEFVKIMLDAIEKNPLSPSQASETENNAERTSRCASCRN
ncbi:uncharacterized protein VTP21DRAFT_2773 [Calcarisporiella thermophila]|uniref:uncharacterized protein n=1 Tax=Calcarisporiella thermophila TaxID=911321 RepID=UPI0037426B20